MRYEVLLWKADVMKLIFVLVYNKALSSGYCNALIINE